MPISHQNLAHWGAFVVDLDEDDAIVAVRASARDTHPSELIGNTTAMRDGRVRVSQPHVRRSWYETRARTGRGQDDYLPLEWDEAIRLVAETLQDTHSRLGPGGVYGGSYGWASAGRFHHAQSQIHRFLNSCGGYTTSLNDYSHGASMVLLPHLVGANQSFRQMTSWSNIAEHTELLLAFGGIPMKNTSVSPGGLGAHTVPDQLAQLSQRGGRIVSVSPIREDAPRIAGAEWLSIRPGTDVAVMLALAFAAVEEDRHDRGFLDTFTTGGEQVISYLRGDLDGVAKSPRWAAELSGIHADRIVELSRMLTEQRSLISVSYSLQRTRFGEQPVWAALTLASIVGQIGLDGGGFAHGLGSMGDLGQPDHRGALPTFPQGRNPVDAFIPCAAITEMLLHPGEEFQYDGGTYRYPEVDLVYWAGGNPFHHHQNLPRFAGALDGLGALIVHEPFWTATARHADVVLPVTTSIERNDIGAARSDPDIIAMRRAVPPLGQARDDYDIFADIAEVLGVRERFTEGRSSAQWLRWMYDHWRQTLADDLGIGVQDFDAFWESGRTTLPTPAPRVFLQEFRADPLRDPLRTPSGRIELYSERIASFGYDDCPGQATWLGAPESHLDVRAERYPLVLIANQPRTRLHSQLDHGMVSMAAKIEGREPVRMSPSVAAARSITDGDTVRLFNERGACLAGARIDPGLLDGVLELATGAWYTPVDDGDGVLCTAGNPNVLTSDVLASRLSHGSAGGRALVELERFDRTPPSTDPHAAPISAAG